MSYIDKYNEWINSKYIDEDIKEELIALKNNEKEIEDRFYKDLEFGTAGMRGIIGAGSNRMNKYTVGKVTQGLANYIVKLKCQDKGVVIGYDSRNMSKEFGQITALCLNANGIKTYLFEDIRPVPEISYAVRKLKCIAGVMITASHNPSKYNGYKVYWEDGAQVTSPKDNEIINEVKQIKNYNQIKTAKETDAVKNGLYKTIGKQIDDYYIEEIKKHIQNKDDIIKQKDLSIVYTPLHGTGYKLVKNVLEDIGFTNINYVKEQCIPDGNFSTVQYPNPEDKDAFKMALELAKQKKAEIVLATDPDADRLGVYVLDLKTKEYKALTGNMSALLIADYILSQKQKRGTLSKNGVIVKSIVSSTMAYPIAKEYNLKVIEVLTGFKYIGEKIKEFEQTNKYTYEFGYEESYGCLVGTYARDKDAIIAVTLLCEAAAYYKNRNMTLWDAMIKMYEKYGFYKEDTFSKTFEGVDGMEKINNVMKELRDFLPSEFGSFKVLKIRDYQSGIIKDLTNNTIEKTELPTSNVLYYELNNDAWVCVRPSGTEPKIKYYIGVKADNMEDSIKKIKELKDSLI